MALCLVTLGFAPQQANAQSLNPLSLSYATCKPVEWLVVRSLPVCDLNYTPTIKTQIRAVIVDDELEKLLDCIWEKESGRGKNMIGDNGLAFGHYQIHLDKHPVSYDCAMDYDCARAYTRRMIEVGRGGEWTSYNDCL